MAFADCYPDLLLPNAFGGREIDAVKMAVSVPLHRFQNKTRSDAVRYAGLDHMVWFQVTNQAPYGASQTGIAVVIGIEACRAGTDSRALQVLKHVLPNLPEFGGRVAWPVRAQMPMEERFPIRIGFGLA